MKATGGVIALLVVLAIVAFVALRQTAGVAMPGAAPGGGIASGPAERADAAKHRAVDDVARAMQAASANRDAAETR